jgi:hypothetical protein
MSAGEPADGAPAPASTFERLGALAALQPITALAAAVPRGHGRIIALYYCSSTLYHIH